MDSARPRGLSAAAARVRPEEGDWGKAAGLGEVAKRFRDTEKWVGWYRALPPRIKLLFDYITDKCDHAGIFKEDYEVASFCIGETVAQEDVEKYLAHKVQRVDEDKLFIPSFIEFQYGALRDNNSVHVSVIRQLQRYGIQVQVESGYSTDPKAVFQRLSAKRKREIMVEDCFRCSYCGAPGDEASLVVDHIVSRSKGGGNEAHNLTTACVPCNSRKTDFDAAEFLRRHSLETKISDRLRYKLGVIKALNAPNTPQNGAKDKEEEKDKEQEKDKDPDPKTSAASSPPSERVASTEGFAVRPEDIDSCRDAWLATLRHFRAARGNLLAHEATLIVRALQRYQSVKAVVWALEGARYEPKTEKFDPAGYIQIERVLDPSKFTRFMNLGLQAFHKMPKVAS
jgi:5-methylcytosine-specific restriction endonuclease McrA